MAEQNKEKASVSMEAQLEKISATIESLSKEVVCDSVVLVCHIWLGVAVEVDVVLAVLAWFP